MVMAWGLSHPSVLTATDRVAGPVLDRAREYYLRWDRAIPSFRPECARYDPDLSYTLRPGSFTFRNREFAVRYDVNRHGLRDDDASVASSDIVIAGDSQAMGWGVSQDDTLAARLESRLSLRVLNAALPSYGTAREMLMLERLKLADHSECRAVVIQYCENDFGENSAYLNAGFRLPVMSHAQYDRVVQDHVRDSHYFPGKILWRLLPRTSPPDSPAPPPPPVAVEVQAFWGVLRHHRSLLVGRVVVVMEINSFGRNDSQFTDAARDWGRTVDDRELADAVSFVDVSRVLTHRDYYALDDHLRPTGHDRVAALVAAELARRGFCRP
jgi:hypothetical protein